MKAGFEAGDGSGVWSEGHVREFGQRQGALVIEGR